MVNPLKVGLRAGAGPLPGYAWTVAYLSIARDEAMDFLNDEQYAHAVDLVRALASEADPSHASVVTVEAIENFLELKDKGGVLGKINLRIYFIIDRGKKAIVILAAIKKEADGQTPTWVKIRVRNRLRKFLAGEFGQLS
ncbi:MAG: hypothetical protein NTV94_08305 [Planctomycetota bacterium]|nr:hypothetical protein [Planctomycetota bacterium]